MTTAFMLAGHSEKRKPVGGVNQGADKNSGEPDKKEILEGVGEGVSEPVSELNESTPHLALGLK
jgi:hypothetical protein